MYDYHSRSHSPTISHPCASSWSIVSGVSAAAKLDAASIIAKNRPERMRDPKAAGGFFQRGRAPLCRTPRQLWPLGHIAARQSCRKRCRRSCPCAGRDEPGPPPGNRARTDHKALERVLKREKQARRELLLALADEVIE